MSRVQVTAVLALLVFGCGEGGPKGTPIDELIASGKCPVEVTAFERIVGPMPTFGLRLTNVSDRPIDAVGWTVVYRDADGKPLPDGVMDGGYANALDPIDPDEGVEGAQPAVDGAVHGTLVIRSVFYVGEMEVGGRMLEFKKEWKNPRYEAELAAARGE